MGGLLEPRLKVTEDLEPISCGSSGYRTFEMYVENVQSEFDIVEMKAYVGGYNITSALSCSPKENVISNEKISCRLNVNELLSDLPECPLRRIDNIFEINIKILTDTGFLSLSDSKTLILIESGIEPSLEITLESVPEVNCKIGSEINIPVLIDHAEVFYKNIEWSFIFNSTKEYENLIECDISLSGDYTLEGKDDVYLCKLSIPDTLFFECSPGEEISLGIKAKNRDYEIEDNISAMTYSQDLDLGLQITDFPNSVECQVINKEGLCVPKDPQRNFKIRITGQPLSNLEVFGFVYTLANEETNTLCEREETLGEQSYSCLLFLPSLTLQETDAGIFEGSEEFNFSLNTRYLNYYTPLSSSKTLTFKGSVSNEIVDRKRALESLKKEMETLRRYYEWAMEVLGFFKMLVCCCGLAEFVEVVGGTVAAETIETTIEEGLMEGFKVLYESLWVVIKENVASEAAKEVLASSAGISAVECFLKAHEKLVDDVIEKLEEFEEEDVSEFDLEIECMEGGFPNYIFCIMTKPWWWSCVASTTAKKILDSITCGLWGCIKDCFLSAFGSLGLAICIATGQCSAEECLKCSTYINSCAAIILVIIYYGAEEISKYCNYVKTALNVISMVIGFLFMWISFSNTQHYIEVALEQMDLQTKAAKDFAIVMEDHIESQMDFITNISTTTNLFQAFQSAFEFPTVSLFFNSTRTGKMLEYNETVCKDDGIIIEYEFNRLNATGDFDLGGSLKIIGGRTLYLTGLNGTIGPHKAVDLFDDPDSSGEYDFMLSYPYGSVTYKLYYYNQTC
jgi:hypothetical protein